MKLKHLLQSPCLPFVMKQNLNFQNISAHKGPVEQPTKFLIQLFIYKLHQKAWYTHRASSTMSSSTKSNTNKQMNKRIQQCFLPLTAGLNTHSVASKVPYNFFQFMFEIELSLFSPVHCYLYPDVGPALCSCYIWYWPHPAREKWACRGGRNVSSDDQVSNRNVNPLALGKMPFEASQAVFWLLQ